MTRRLPSSTQPEGREGNHRPLVITDQDDDDLALGSEAALPTPLPPSPSEELVALLHPDDENQDNERSSSGESERSPSPSPSQESEGSDASTKQSVSLHEDDAPFIGRASGINVTRRPLSSRPWRTPDHFIPE